MYEFLINTALYEQETFFPIPKHFSKMLKKKKINDLLNASCIIKTNY